MRAVVAQCPVGALARLVGVHVVVFAVREDAPQGLAERVGDEVLEPAAGLPAQRRLQRVVVRNRVVFPPADVAERGERPQGIDGVARQGRPLDRVRQISVAQRSRQQPSFRDDVELAPVQQVPAERADVTYLQDVLPRQAPRQRQAGVGGPRVIDRVRVDRVDVAPAQPSDGVDQANGVVGEAHRPQVRARVGVDARRVPVGRDADDVVLGVAHRPIVEEPGPAAQNRVAGPADVPGEVDARHDEERPIAYEPLWHLAQGRVGDAVDVLLVGVQEGARVRVVPLRDEDRTQAARFLVVGPLAEPHAVLEREVLLDLPRVLEVAVEAPSDEVARVQSGSGVDLGGPADKQVAEVVSGRARDPARAQRDRGVRAVLEVLELVPLLDAEPDLHRVGVQDLREVVGELQARVVGEDVVLVRGVPQVPEALPPRVDLDRGEGRLRAVEALVVVDAEAGQRDLALVGVDVVELQLAEAEDELVGDGGREHARQVDRGRPP